jgi:hypothetical protein
MSTTEQDRSEVLEALWTEAAKLKGVDRIGATDWAALEDCLAGSKRSDEYAAALHDLWREEKGESGFNQPAGSLVRLVTDLAGDPFEEEDEE